MSYTVRLPSPLFVAVRHEIQDVLALHLVDVLFGIGLAQQSIQGVAIRPIGAKTAMVLYEIKIRIDRRGDADATLVVVRGFLLGTNEACSDSPQFDRFAARSIDDVFKAANRVSAPLAGLVPF